jgi:hypothetical protein
LREVAEEPSSEVLTTMFPTVAPFAAPPAKVLFDSERSVIMGAEVTVMAKLLLVVAAIAVEVNRTMGRIAFSVTFIAASPMSFRPISVDRDPGSSDPRLRP